MNWEKSDWMVSTGKMETKACLVLLARKGILGEGVTKDLKGTEENEEVLEFEGTRVTQDGTASREDPKAKPETLGPWASLGEMARLEGLEISARMAAMAEGDRPELRATRVAQASQVLQESRGPEVHRVQLVPLALQV